MGWSSDLGSDLAQASIPSRLKPAPKHFRWALSTSSSWRQMGSRLKPTDSELRHRSSSSVRKTRSCVPFGNPLVEQDLVRRRRNGIKLFDFAQPTARSMKPDRGEMLAADGRQSLFVRRPLVAQVVHGLRRSGHGRCPWACHPDADHVDHESSSFQSGLTSRKNVSKKVLTDFRFRACRAVSKVNTTFKSGVLCRCLLKNC